MLFDRAYQVMADERGVQIEAIVAMLASVGGHLCLTSVLDSLQEAKRTPESIEMVAGRGKDGELYYFGDAPNWLLCEAPYSIISLVFGAAHQHGAQVSLEMLHEEMKKVAERAGTEHFLELDPQGPKVDSPLNWARLFTSFVKGSVMDGMAPAFRLPIVVGFALQVAIDKGHQALDAMTLARIAMQCALRAAKLDPARVARPSES